MVNYGKYKQKVMITTQKYIQGCGLYCERDRSVFTGNDSVKRCSHVTSVFAFASTSPSKFNIASMVTQTQM